MCCNQCIDSNPIPDYLASEILDMTPELTALKLAAKLGVPSDQITIHDYGVQVFLDSFQIQSLVRRP